jgi:endogenous inhibitor of DNA gyrase (YacG/DUF329 family)
MQQKLIYGGIIVGVVAVAIVIWAMWTPANNANFPQGTDWLCLNKSCANHFNLTIKQVSDHHKAHYGQPMKCPKCGNEAERAVKCAHCAKVYMQMRGASTCPFCRKQQPPPAD